MNLTLTHKIRLQPNAREIDYFNRACGIARFSWNWGLSHWKKAYEAGEKPSGLELKKAFNACKKTDFPWVYEVTKYACQQPFIFLQQAFVNFFSGRANYPKFKAKGIHDSFYIGNDHIAIKGKKIRIPKLGWVKMREALRFTGRVISVTISRTANKWFASVHVQTNQSVPGCKSQASVGIDLGISCLATLYDGSSFKEVKGSKPLKRLQHKLKRAQRRLSKMVKGSNNRKKQQLVVANLHYKIRCIRQDELHKLTTQLTQDYQKIGIEDLNVKGMMANHCLARSISDMGFYELRRQLDYKAELNGNELILMDRWYASSKICSRCGEKKERLSLSDREFYCERCDLRLGRDKNASVNIYNTVSSTGIKVCGEVSAGSCQMV